MDHTIDLANSLEVEISGLKRALANPMSIGDAYPGHSQVERIKEILAELEAALQKAQNAQGS